MVLVRTDNSRMKSTTKNVPLYNQKRYKLRVAEDLETISVPLTASSMTLIERVRASATLVSNPALVHVTLVEGLRAAMPNTLIQELSNALATAPVLKVRNAKLVACDGDKNYTLVTLELEPVAAAVAKRVRALVLHSSCILPQWPLHVALGVAPKAQAERAARVLLDSHRGTVLAVDASRLATLPPSTALFFN